MEPSLQGMENSYAKWRSCIPHTAKTRFNTSDLLVQAYDFSVTKIRADRGRRGEMIWLLAPPHLRHNLSKERGKTKIQNEKKEWFEITFVLIVKIAKA